MPPAIRGLAAATLLGLGSLALATVGLVVVLPLLVAQRWRRRTHDIRDPY